MFRSHERVLEAITEEAEKQDIERFQPLITGMSNHNIALKVLQTKNPRLFNAYDRWTCIFCCCLSWIHFSCHIHFARVAACNWSMLWSAEEKS